MPLTEIEPKGKTALLQEKLFYGTLKGLHEAGGILKRREALAWIETNVVFTEWELAYATEESKYPRWRSTVTFHLVGLVKAKFMEKTKEGWKITSKGVEALEKSSPSELRNMAVRLYNEWSKEDKAMELAAQSQTEDFDWIPLYEELALLLSQYEDRQEELVALLDRLRDAGLPTTPMNDKDADGNRFLLEEIDPFTFFGSFNRDTSLKARQQIVQEVIDYFGAENGVPNNFNGIPTLNNQSSWFISYTYRRGKNDISTLWKLFKLALEDDPLENPEFISTLNDSFSIRGVGTNITQGLFWIQPDKFISFDSRNREYLGLTFKRKERSGEKYKELLGEVRDKYSGIPFTTISHNAWLSQQDDNSSTSPAISNITNSYIEMTKTNHNHGGKGWEFGTCLWSPSSRADGRDWYNIMRRLSPGDEVIHINDSIIVGKSVVKSGYVETGEEPPEAGKWAGREKYYRVELENFTQFDTPIDLSEFSFKNEAVIKDDLSGDSRPDKYLFQLYGKSNQIRTVQGIYLSKCTTRLQNALALLSNQTITNQQIKKLTANNYWLVGAWWDESDPQNQTDRFVKEGIWANGYDNKYRNLVERMQPGDKIAIKACATQKINLPFDAKGNTASKNIIKARGTITKKHDDGKTVDVDWDSNFKNRDWYFYTGRNTVWRLQVDDDYKLKKYVRKLIDFIWNDVPQDYGWFVDQWGWNEAKTLIDEEEVIDPAFVVEYPDYTIDDATNDVFLSQSEFTNIVDNLKRKKNIILQGPPGVGKTYVAKRLAYLLMGKKDPGRVQMVQFHQSYSYEDFVQGWRPKETGGFSLQNGVFYTFCNAANKSDQKHVFIIDEINRGNLSRIFGELMMLIESDKRGPGFSIPLTYAQEGDKKFHVPENVYVMGLMNTADRSLAIVDYALRRRFTFMTLEPQFKSESFRTHLQGVGVNSKLISRIVSRLSNLNEEIASDTKNLGPGYVIGHSFFCPTSKGLVLDDDWYKTIVLNEVKPLLEEYWFDDSKKADNAVDALLG